MNTLWKYIHGMNIREGDGVFRWKDNAGKAQRVMPFQSHVPNLNVPLRA